MRFKLSDSHLTGVKHLDDDHRELVARINAVADCERTNDKTVLIEALDDFKTDLVEHFRSEEARLMSVKYPKVGSHAKHHSETIVGLERLISAVKNDEPVGDSVADNCFHELISAVLLRDMEFINWLADRPGLGAKPLGP